MPALHNVIALTKSRATARPRLDQQQWRTSPSGLRRELAGETITQLLDDVGDAADAGRSTIRS